MELIRVEGKITEWKEEIFSHGYETKRNQVFKSFVPNSRYCVTVTAIYESNEQSSITSKEILACKYFPIYSGIS